MIAFPRLVHELALHSAARRAEDVALAYRQARWSYGEFATAIEQIGRGLVGAGLARHDRVAVYLEKRLETVAAIFGTAYAGGIFVPVNPVLKPPQVAHILRDSGARFLVTSRARFDALPESIADCTELATVILIEGDSEEGARSDSIQLLSWSRLLGEAPGHHGHRAIDTDIAAILYTSGSTGLPKGVVLTHRNMVAGAESVASYIENVPDDRILAVLPLSFDAGFSQLTTAFCAGASVYLMNYLLPREVPKAVARHGITGITAVPPVWIPLSRLAWPAEPRTLRYIANTGGAMPVTTVKKLRTLLPDTRVFLMYGLTEAFRSTYLPPEEVERRPESIGKAIPNAEILVVRPDGTPCATNEPGELVHRGALVAQGYWQDPERTAARFRPAPGQPAGTTVAELAVWSGDTVRADAEGFLYFVGRRDEMIKTSGYRVSPTEIEETVYASGQVAEVVALGIPHPELGQAIVLAAVPADGAPLKLDRLMEFCRERLPGFMVPAHIETRKALPRNPNGKIDRKGLAAELAESFAATGH